MAHVLEHINDPVQLLQRAKTWLAEDGIILASVPNAWSFHRLTAVKMGLLQTPTELNPRDLSVGHRRVYTPEAFKADFGAAGLTILKQGGILFKAMSNQQLQDYCTEDMLEGYYQLGSEFPEYAAEIYIVAQ